MYYNKRLHPRQPPGHYTGCMLHELEQQQEAVSRSSNKLSRHSSMSSLDSTRSCRRKSSIDTGGSYQTSTSKLSNVSSHKPRDYIRRASSSATNDSIASVNYNFSPWLIDDGTDALYRTSRQTTPKNVTFCGTKTHDSPEHIIAKLFPQSVATKKSTSNIRKGSVDSYLNKKPASVNVSSTLYKQKNLYRPDSLMSLDTDFESIK